VIYIKRRFAPEVLNSWHEQSIAMNHFFILLEEWERLDEAAFRAESLLERTLDEYCEGMGPAPSLAEIRSARRLRFLATEHLMSIRHVLGQARENATVI
jgi:hypothetical protein